MARLSGIAALPWIASRRALKAGVRGDGRPTTTNRDRHRRRAAGRRGDRRGAGGRRLDGRRACPSCRATTCRQARARSSPTSPIAGCGRGDLRRGARRSRRSRCWSTMPRASPGTGRARSTRHEFDAHMAINARAPALLIDALARRHRTGSGCAASSTCSIRKLAAPNPDYLSYTVSKQALAALTDLYARALARARHPGQCDRAGADAALERAERGELSRRCTPTTRSAAGSSPTMWSPRSAISPTRRAVTGQTHRDRRRPALPGARPRRPVPGSAMSGERPSSTAWCPTISRSARRGSSSIRSRSRPTSAFTISRSARRSACWSRSKSGSTMRRCPTATIRRAAWNYDFLRPEVEELAASRRFNLQETLAHAIFERIAAFHGVRDVCASARRSPTSIPMRTGSASKSLPFPELGPKS